MSLTESLATDPVSRLNMREPVLLCNSPTVRDAITAMRERELGCAILVDAHNKPCGMFTEAMLREKLAHSMAFLDEPLSDHVATSFPWVRLDDPVEMVLDAMQANNTRFICVVDGEGRVAGLTGQKGLMEFIAECCPHQVVVHRVGGDQYADQREGA